MVAEHYPNDGQDYHAITTHDWTIFEAVGGRCLSLG